MAFKVIICRDFDHMSEVAGNIAVENINENMAKKGSFVLGLATGNSPTGLYKHLAKSANAGEFDASKIRSFNLDEYIGLPGENAQQRALHPESYSYFMIQELFGLLQKKFVETNVPWGTLIDQEQLIAELENNPGDWEEQGTEKGKAIVIKSDAASEYLRWVRKQTIDAYVAKIDNAGGIDLHIIGVGGRGHVAFHESGIPFDGNKMLLVKLDDNTVANAVEDGHFSSKQDSPWYALSMGAEQVYKARTVLLLANGPRKSSPVAESLVNDPTPDVPISYSQLYAENGGNMIYVIDKAAAKDVLANSAKIQEKGIEIEDISGESCSVKVEDLTFFRNPDTCLMG
ncbi:MAG TPA: 6-phosphogluconolactonase [Deltaproteobacteria bacterium]|nr:6-phosphogluconolactonase [Deltaproteobacteria bacterium]HPJ92764.1 6-phosphogluconolactonase [Deltaproteobacteria bacterium]HPR50759.1 6-phosphogluconolactonase [Deltaproteobacteria bacterium]